MGAKTALLAFAEGDIRVALAGAGDSDPERTEALVRRVHVGYDIEPDEDGTLLDDVYPPDDRTYAIAVDGLELLCDRRFMLDRPSELPEHLLELGAGRRIVLHGMHSVVDWLAFAVWENGTLVRSLSLSPDGGVMENIGEPYAFEQPYWAGEHPVKEVPGWPSKGPYPLPFHPLDLGEEALRALFGFIVEGHTMPDDIDAEEVALYGFQVTDPSGEEQAEREAAYAHAREKMGPPRIFRPGPDGTMQEISFDDLRLLVAPSREDGNPDQDPGQAEEAGRAPAE
jgi:Family of unknown function (DUF6928)